MSKTICLIMGDQLSKSISSLQEIDKENSVVLMLELAEEANHVKHHKKKIIFVLSAMRHFAQELRAFGFNVDYVSLDDEQNTGSFISELERAIKRHNAKKVILTEPSEYRLLNVIVSWGRKLSIDFDCFEDNRFLSSKIFFKNWAKSRKSLRMEFFYRDLRRKYRVLMDGEYPVSGRWNYDAENRLKPPKALLVTPPLAFETDEITKSVVEMVDLYFDEHFGQSLPFNYAVTASQAEAVFEQFLCFRLNTFGSLQDAMMVDEPWMSHSLISMYINVGLLDALTCIRKTEKRFLDGYSPLNSVEGFIRQILGWREYIRGIYWYKMPSYMSVNELDLHRKLPDFLWTGETRLNCVKQVVKQTKIHSYAHHIQRLMIIGNFLLLVGTDPKWVHEWFYIVYIDAFEWVELPNVIGMSQFADGGVVASKPYVSSGKYIDRMSNYCKSCSYKVNERDGENACPFNYLYWGFLIKHETVFRENHRMGMVYKTLDKMGGTTREKIINNSDRFISNLNVDY